MATISLVVPAAGCGARAGLNRNKVLAPLLGRPLLWWTLRALCDARALPLSTHVTELIVAARPEEFEEVQAAITPLPATAIPATAIPATAIPGTSISGTSLPDSSSAAVFSFFHPASSPSPRISLHLVEGGDSRQASVANAVGAASGDFVLVHDAARPLVSPLVVERVLRAALRHDAAIAALPVSDTVKIALDSSDVVHLSASSEQAAQQSAAIATIEETVERSRVYLAQTPQIFRRAILQEALNQAALDNFTGTDCSSLVERLRDENGARRFPVALVAGEARNFKITYASDLERAAVLLQTSNVA